MATLLEIDEKRKIWIVVPVFNRSKEIYSLLSQIFLQTYKNFNILIVDHGTKNIDFSNFSDPRLSIINRSSRLWWTGAINSGIQEIIVRAEKDDYCLLINDDVLVTQDFLKNIILVAENHPDSIT